MDVAVAAPAYNDDDDDNSNNDRGEEEEGVDQSSSRNRSLLDFWMPRLLIKETRDEVE